MSFYAWRHGFRVREIPIIFVDRRVGISKMNRKIILEAIFMVWRLFFLRLVRIRGAGTAARRGPRDERAAARSGGARRRRGDRPPRVSIVIVHFRTPDVLAVCLETHRAAARISVPWEVLVVDNAPLDDAARADRARADPGCGTTRTSSNVGFGRAVNQGIAHGPRARTSSSSIPTWRCTRAASRS